MPPTLTLIVLIAYMERFCCNNTMAFLSKEKFIFPSPKMHVTYYEGQVSTGHLWEEMLTQVTGKHLKLNNYYLKAVLRALRYDVVNSTRGGETVPKTQ